MKPEIAKEWVEALNSGNYKQRQNILSDGERYCCLGVLCDIASKKGIIATGRYGQNGRICLEYGSDDKSTSLPKEVMEWSGIKTDLGHFGSGNLANKNDTGKNFQAIAELIEKHIEVL